MKCQSNLYKSLVHSFILSLQTCKIKVTVTFLLHIRSFLSFPTSTYRPTEVLNIVFIGPFPEKGSVLEIIDTFSRWVELYATKDAIAKAACTCLIEHFGCFNHPSFIRSDNGSHFVNHLVLRIHWHSTKPYISLFLGGKCNRRTL